MRKRMSVLLASTMTTVGLVAGVTPAHAAPKPEANSGLAYPMQNYRGLSTSLRSGVSCEEIGLPGGNPARSVANTSTSSKITLYAGYLFGICFDEIVVLEPGERDTGVQTELGLSGATAYSST